MFRLLVGLWSFLLIHCVLDLLLLHCYVSFCSIILPSYGIGHLEFLFYVTAAGRFLLLLNL